MWTKLTSFLLKEKTVYLKVNLENLADVTDVYMVKRRTVWQIVDHNTLIIFAADGKCSIDMDGENYLLDKGSLFIVPSGHHYIRRPVNNEMCTLYYIHVDLHNGSEVLDDSFAAEEIRRRKSEHTDIVSHGDIDKCHEYFLHIHTDLSSKLENMVELYEYAINTAVKDHAESQTKLSLIASQILINAASVALRESVVQNISNTAPTKKLRKVFAYIKLHSKENITLDELCSISNFSRQHLIRVFRSEFGMTPKAYILNYRINCAKELFYRDPTLSVKEVAYELGFEDQHYFSRIFSKVTGQTPSEYKDHLINFDPSKQ